MDGDEPARVKRRAVTALVLRILECQLPAELDEFPAQRDRVAGLDAQPGNTVAQPDGVNSARVVVDRRFEALQAARQMFDLDALQRAQNGALGLKKEIRDRRGGREGLVADRKVEEKIAHREDAQAGKEARS